MKTKKLLFVTEVYPFPLDRGQRVRVWNLIRACAAVCDVTFVGPRPPDGVDPSELERCCEETIHADVNPSEWPDRLVAVAETARLAPGIRSPASIRRYAPYVAALRLARPERFDLIWAERPQMACLCRDFRERLILDFDDIEHLKTAGRFEVERGAWTRMHNAYRYAFYRRLELNWSRECLASVVCSEQDRAYLARHGCNDAIVVPNAALSMPEGALLEPRLRDPNAPLKLAFLGHLASQPNADAISVLTGEVLPALLADFPGATLDVIGGGELPTKHPEAPNVHFRGFVEDLGSVLAEYDMLVAPLRYGGGTKLKVLDAMAHGLPVVTTSVGAQGLPLVHEKHAMIAETVPDLVAAIGRVKRDAEFASRLASEAYKLVHDQFSWKEVRRDLSARLASLASAGSSARATQDAMRPRVSIPAAHLQEAVDTEHGP